MKETSYRDEDISFTPNQAETGGSVKKGARKISI
jgi:hypothetical protein